VPAAAPGVASVGAVETPWSMFGAEVDAEGTPAPVAEDSLPPLEVEVIRSAKRRKTVSASIVDGRVVVRMPTFMTKAQEAEYVAALVDKLARQRRPEAVDLPARAAALARRYQLPQPASIRFVSNQARRWGSCTPSTGEIRLSDRIAAFPVWVLDAVIVHELAHLVHHGHTPEFWSLANRYPRTERAHGFLIAKQLTDDDVE
jgi:predicted metal-dependent hydrolase